MSTVTASDVKELREKTGAGMMDCKKALVESGGDFEKAIEFLRKKGQKLAAKREDRDASEGRVIVRTSQDGKKALIFSLNCETDFVAKNDGFVDFANELGDIAAGSFPSTTEEFLALPFSGGITVGERLTEEIGKIGEKLEIGGYGVVEAEQIGSYIHNDFKQGSIVGFNKEVNDEVSKNMAMQIVAFKPVAIDKDDVPQDMVEKEIEIGKEQARNEGKPENMLEKIAMGKLGKFYKQSTLLNQEFINDPKTSVTNYLKSQDGDLTVTAFKRVTL